MNIRQLLPYANQLFGRDITNEVEGFFSAREAVGKALNPEGQKFVIDHWRGLADFMHTPAGQAAIVTFMESWGKHMTSVLSGTQIGAVPAPVTNPPAAPAIDPQP